MWYVKSRKKPKNDKRGLSKPPGTENKFKECSLGQDKNGYYCYTHRARSDSYPSIETIPNSVVDFINSTG